jgi:nucleotide-binding universal stress UspA family protein
MSYKTLMAHLELGRSNAGLLHITAALAKCFDAAVIGIASKHPAIIAYGDGSMGGAFVERDRDQIAEDIKVAEAAFRKALEGKVKALEWRSSTSFEPLSDFLAFESRSADLLITGVTRDALGEENGGLNAGDLLMQIGRPVLIVPRECASLSLDRMMIAWKDTPEMRRATLDALPMLKQAKQVTLVEVVEKADVKRVRRGLDDLVIWLGAHGVPVTALAATTEGDVADRLRQLAAEHKADLVIAGAYGHSRLREWALGGVTRDLLVRSDLCALVSH